MIAPPPLDAEALASGLTDACAGAREASARALVALGGGEAAAAAAALLADPDLAVCTAAGAVLLRLGPPAVDAIAPCLGHASPDVRRQALELLARLPAERLAEEVAARLGDRDPNVVLAAVDALGMLGAAPFASALLRLYEAEPTARPSVVAALARAQAPEAAPLVARALSSDDAVLHAAAAAALADLGGAALPLLEALLGHAAGPARAVALDAFVRWHDGRPGTPFPEGLAGELIALLSDPDPAYRQSAANGLRALADRVDPGAFLAHAGREDALDVALFEVLAARERPAEALLEAGDVTPPHAAAAFALGLVARGLVAPGALTGLADFLARRFAALDAETRLAGLALCGRLGRPELRPVLLRGLSDPDPSVAAAAADALATGGAG